MATTTEALRAGGSGPPARPLSVSRARTERRRLLDRWAARLVALGGIIIVGSILAILLVITAQVYPLFTPPAMSLLGTRALADGPAATPVGASFGVDEYREMAFVVTADGALRFVALQGGGPIAPRPVPGLEGARVTAVAALGGPRYLLGTSDGRAIPLDVTFAVEFTEGRRTVRPDAAFGTPAMLDPGRRRPIGRLAAGGPESRPIAMAQVGPRDLVALSVVESKTLIGGSRREESLEPLPVALDGDITALVLDGRGDDLFIGTSRGEVIRYDLRDRATPLRAEVASVSEAAVGVLGFLNGDRTLIVGDARGGVSTWQVVPPPGGGSARLTRVYEFPPHPGPVVALAASRRDKGFATADRSGRIHLSYGTSGQTLLTADAPRGELTAVLIAPKSDALLTADARGGLTHWALKNPHPETTLATLFGRVWYEGYSRPEYVWQSTGGTDDFEPKFSLTPLIFGTLKGTFYALLVAVPLALLAALYVSEFMHPTLKGYIKPVVEIMAALPSVVLGFLAGLWLAPLIEQIVPGLVVFPLVVTVAILVAQVAWRTLPVRLRGGVHPGGEVFVLLPVVALGAWLAVVVGGLLEGGLLDGDYRGWLLSALGLTYDQRNSLVVGIVMGFAVIPLIFTIAEDSLANVPQHLRAGSLALGATRWQTAIRVVLPTASPGIFSAVMIGFGRAVGETMIVLMATGNTPVMDWSAFSGFRALSANIAVELPEAPEGGTLFRVLFLAAFLLFCLTFTVNTLAEVVRLRLRRKYRYL